MTRSPRAERARRGAARSVRDHAAGVRCRPGRGCCRTSGAGAARGAGCPTARMRVLDVGCAFGYGSAALRRPPGRRVVGVERDPATSRPRARICPCIVFLEGDADALPVADGVRRRGRRCSTSSSTWADPRRRWPRPTASLRPGGVLVISVPHRGLLHRFDALNVYSAPAPPPAALAAPGAGDGVRRPRAPPLHPRRARGAAAAGFASTGSPAPASASRS